MRGGAAAAGTARRGQDSAVVPPRPSLVPRSMSRITAIATSANFIAEWPHGPRPGTINSAPRYTCLRGRYDHASPLAEMRAAMAAVRPRPLMHLCCCLLVVAVVVVLTLA
jgi:hypothetical protein